MRISRREIRRSHTNRRLETVADRFAAGESQSDLGLGVFACPQAGQGVGLRPHIKTAKSARVAELAHGGAKGPLTVSTLKEAEYFFDHGFSDLTYAVGMAPAKLERASRLRAKGTPFCRYRSRGSI